ncbi:MAG: N-acetylmuramoyl-L-alanine amidase [Alphaproteobacteria bacterium]
MKQVPSPNFDKRKSAINMLVFHYTGRPDLKESLAWLTDPAKKVSAHYLIGETGEVFQLVDEKMRAWHAGVSFWAGNRDINSCSIGVGIQNPGHEFGYQDFPDIQIEALVSLSKEIIARHSIPRTRILGHSDVAPDRRQDPGEKFPWEILAREGIGRWPEKISKEDTPDLATFRTFLEDLGYEISGDCPVEKVVKAFQRHWHPENVTGQPDAGTYSRLKALL